MRVVAAAVAESLLFLGMIVAFLIQEHVKEGGAQLEVVLVVAIKMTMA